VGEAIIHAFSGAESRPGMRYAIVALALAASIGVAWAFWYFIEKPSQAWGRASSGSASSRVIPPFAAHTDSVRMEEKS
jgi:peptidoglycan/LPS O-acetylase OafA/YrhL